MAVQWMQANPRAAYATYFALYILVTVLALPAFPLTVAAGSLFGPAAGTMLVSVSSVAGATAAFLVGRTFARGFVEARVGGNPRFAALDRAIGRGGFVVVLLTRLSPLFPFNLLNYAYGVSRVSLPNYVLGSWLGMLPVTAAYVAAGAAAGALAGVPVGPSGATPMSPWLTAIAAVTTVLVTWIVMRLARRELERSLL